MKISKDNINNISIIGSDDTIKITDNYTGTVANFIDTDFLNRHYFLYNEFGDDDDIFRDLSLNKDKFALEILGYTGRSKTTPFPACESLSALTMVIKALFEEVEKLKKENIIYKWAQGKDAIKLLEKEGGKNTKSWKEENSSSLFYMPLSGGIIECSYIEWATQCDYIKSHGIEIKSKVFLNESENMYLRDVIRPFRDRILKIRKTKSSVFENEEYIEFLLDDDSFNLPNMVEGTSYKGMESNKSYTLEELGL